MVGAYKRITSNHWLGGGKKGQKGAKGIFEIWTITEKRDRGGKVNTAAPKVCGQHDHDYYNKRRNLISCSVGECTWGIKGEKWLKVRHAIK